MKGSFQDGSSDSFFWGLVIFISITAFVSTLVMLHLKSYQIRGFMIRLKKMLMGTYRPSRRYPSAASISILLPFGPDKVEHTQTVDLSVGGMFVKKIDPLPVGEIFEFYLEVGEVDRMLAEAEVVWVQKKWSEHHPSGMGCKFRNLTQKNKNRIRLYLRQ